MADGFALIDFDRDIQYNQEFARLFTITKQSEVWEKLKLTHTTKQKYPSNLHSDIDSFFNRLDSFESSFSEDDEQ